MILTTPGDQEIMADLAVRQAIKAYPAQADDMPEWRMCAIGFAELFRNLFSCKRRTPTEVGNWALIN